LGAMTGMGSRGREGRRAAATPPPLPFTPRGAHLPLAARAEVVGRNHVLVTEAVQLSPAQPLDERLRGGARHCLWRSHRAHRMLYSVQAQRAR
jgi:hypothetical protein